MNKGFTLIEMLLYSALLVVLWGGLIGLGFSVVRSDAQLINRQEIFENERFMISKVSCALKGATDINSPTGGGSGTILSVDTASTSYNPYVFDVSNGVFRLSVNNNAPVSITNSLVKVSSVTFENYSLSPDTKNTIRFMGNVKSADPGVRASASFDVLITIQ